MVSKKINLKGLPSLNTAGMTNKDMRGLHKINFNDSLKIKKSPVVCKISPDFDAYMKKIQLDEISKNNLFLSKAQISDLILGKLKEKNKEKRIGLF